MPKKKPFGGMGIKLDANLVKVLGGKVGSVIPPFEMTRRLWIYIKTNGLKTKSS